MHERETGDWFRSGHPARDVEVSRKVSTVISIIVILLFGDSEDSEDSEDSVRILRILRILWKMRILLGF